ncbi:MAG: ABC transporter ATP-binding protein [Peptostreptococcaceae bacterium]|nr:ABC transporter ATP-binding protein [Peptostreptococcaceae bacterium]
MRKGEGYMWSEIKKLGWFIKERRVHYLIGIICLQIVNLLVVFPPILIGRALDAIAKGGLTASKLFWFVGLMLLIVTTEYLLSCVWAYKIFQNSILVDRTLRGRMMSKILRMPRTFFERFSSGDLMARATSDIDAISELFGFGVFALSDGIGYLGTNLLAMGFLISWKLTIVSVLPLPILAILTNHIGKYIHRLFTEQQKAFSEMNDEVLEQVNGIRVVRSYVLEEQSVAHFEKTTEKLFKRSLKTELVSGSFWPATKIFTSISYAIAIIYGTGMVVGGEITLGQLISFNVYLNYLIWPMFALGEFMNVAQRGTTSIERIYEVLRARDNEHEKGTVALDGSIESIRFQNYSFRYPTSTTPALKNIDLQTKKGQTIGIVGKTGSGKSTLIKQLLKEYPVGEGELCISEDPIGAIERSSLMERIGYVSQDNVLFSKSIRENILMGKEDAEEEQLRAIIRLSDLSRDIEQFADGMDTLVGERGIAISGGQKQRISIARALIKDPEILLMDDSLSAVDSRTEARIIKNIREDRKGKTTWIATHRLSAVSHADEIIVLEDGMIRERGTHEELIALGGWYEEQYKIQQMEEADDDER